MDRRRRRHRRLRDRGAVEDLPRQWRFSITLRLVNPRLISSNSSSSISPTSSSHLISSRQTSSSRRNSSSSSSDLWLTFVQLIVNRSRHKDRPLFALLLLLLPLPLLLLLALSNSHRRRTVLRRLTSFRRAPRLLLSRPSSPHRSRVPSLVQQ